VDVDTVDSNSSSVVLAHSIIYRIVTKQRNKIYRRFLKHKKRKNMITTNVDTVPAVKKRRIALIILFFYSRNK